MDPHPAFALYRDPNTDEISRDAVSDRRFLLAVRVRIMYFGTLVWQVLEEGRLSTCKLYVYVM